MAYESFYQDHIAAIRQRTGDTPIARYFEATNPEVPIARRGEIQRMQSRRIILRHPQTDSVLWVDRRGNAFTLKSAKDTAQFLIEEIVRQDAARLAKVA